MTTLKAHIELNGYATALQLSEMTFLFGLTRDSKEGSQHLKI